MISADFARARLSYDPSSGYLTWLKIDGDDRFTRTRNSRFAGRLAGTERRTAAGKTYQSVNIGGRFYLAHRLIWLMMTGKWPISLIDHVDGDGANNIWTNLRQATPQQNVFNRKIRKDNPTGFKGVRCHRDGKRFQARITVNRRSVYLGLYSTAEDAAKAYDTAARLSQGEFASPNFS
jgi:hypothetical protein